MVRKIVLGAAALLISGGIAHATTFSGSSTFTDTGDGKGGKNVQFNNITASNFSTALSAGQSTTWSSFVTVTGTYTGNGKSATDNVQLSFNFTQPGMQIASITGSGTVSQTQNSWWQGGQIDTSGNIIWTGATNLTKTGANYVQDTVTFADGVVATLDVYNIALSCADQNSCSDYGNNNGWYQSGDNVTGTGMVVLTDIMDVPEPASLALLGTALVGFGFVSRRRARKV